MLDDFQYWVVILFTNPKRVFGPYRYLEACEKAKELKELEIDGGSGFVAIVVKLERE